MSAKEATHPGNGKGRMRYRAREIFNEAYGTKGLSAVTA